jgi:hypothetical protein
VLELLAVVPFLCAVPALFAKSRQQLLRNARSRQCRSAPRPLPMMAILPFMIYQLAGFGTLHFVVSRPINWIINIAILGLIIAAYIANRLGDYGIEKAFAGLLILGMGAAVLYGILKLRQMQTDYDLRLPHKEDK